MKKREAEKKKLKIKEENEEDKEQDAMDDDMGFTTIEDNRKQVKKDKK